MLEPMQFNENAQIYDAVIEILEKYYTQQEDFAFNFDDSSTQGSVNGQFRF